MIRGKLVDPVVKALVNNNAIDKFEYNVMPFKRLMAYYKCAIMEVETKFKVLNQEFSLEYDRNPIETIKTRLKSPEGIVKKIKRKDLPFSLQSIEENINDIKEMDNIDFLTKLQIESTSYEDNNVLENLDKSKNHDVEVVFGKIEKMAGNSVGGSIRGNWEFNFTINAKEMEERTKVYNIDKEVEIKENNKTWGNR